MPGEKKNVFISHIHEDDEVLQNLKDLLSKSKYEMRDSSIDSSKPNKASSENYIKTEILAPRIKWASVLVVLVSPDTKNSQWVDWEIEYAHQNGKRIVGVWDRGASGADLPQNLELYGDALVGWQADRVIDAITGKINTFSDPDGQQSPPRQIPRYSCD